MVQDFGVTVSVFRDLFDILFQSNTVRANTMTFTSLFILRTSMNSPIGYSNYCGYCSEMGAIMLPKESIRNESNFLRHMNFVSKRDECMFSSLIMHLHVLHILSTVCVCAPVAGSTKLIECVVAITYPLQAHVCPPLITVNDTSRFYEMLGIVGWLHLSLVTST